MADKSIQSEAEEGVVEEITPEALVTLLDDSGRGFLGAEDAVTQDTGQTYYYALIDFTSFSTESGFIDNFLESIDYEALDYDAYVEGSENLGSVSNEIDGDQWILKSVVSINMSPYLVNGYYLESTIDTTTDYTVVDIDEYSYTTTSYEANEISRLTDRFGSSITSSAELESLISTEISGMAIELGTLPESVQIDNMAPKSLLYPEIATSFAYNEGVSYQTSSAYSSQAVSADTGTGGSY